MDQRLFNETSQSCKYEMYIKQKSIITVLETNRFLWGIENVERRRSDQVHYFYSSFISDVCASCEIRASEQANKANAIFCPNLIVHICSSFSKQPQCVSRHLRTPQFMQVQLTAS